MASARAGDRLLLRLMDGEGVLVLGTEAARAGRAASVELGLRLRR